MWCYGRKSRFWAKNWSLKSPLGKIFFPRYRDCSVRQQIHGAKDFNFVDHAFGAPGQDLNWQSWILARLFPALLS